MEVTSPKKFTPSKRGKKPTEQDPNADTDSGLGSSVPSEEDETETTEAAVDDGLPHPRVSSTVYYYETILISVFSCNVSPSNHAASSSCGRPASGRRSS